MDAAEVNALFTGYIEQSTIELLADIGTQFQSAAVTTWLPDITAIIGFAGQGIAGSLALGTSNNCLAALGKLGRAELPEDWLGELSNQLLGRVKRRLSPHGAVFGLGTPVVISGDRLRVSAGVEKTPALHCAVESDIGRVEVWFEFEFRDGFVLKDQAEEDGSLIEGEALLF